ncbi:DUF6193 family natural product biosynthesis protein [Streptomyces cinereoruber]|uniref:DUF6193 family natural product biosynthesis protein n=1 Tax=Streptomyces cinereoruber TaxID=67260 RepID=UPI0027E5316C|nr:DUF6193 family natural product biosynthesis protein [Streptomyces cinereoruber]
MAGTRAGPCGPRWGVRPRGSGSSCPSRTGRRVASRNTSTRGAVGARWWSHPERDVGLSRCTSRTTAPPWPVDGPWTWPKWPGPQRRGRAAPASGRPGRAPRSSNSGPGPSTTSGSRSIPQPVLRRLMPVNSHFNLWFSTSVKEARKAGIGYGIRPYDEDGLYAVRNRGKLLARTGTAEEAVAVLVAALPEGIGPAR